MGGGYPCHFAATGSWGTIQLLWRFRARGVGMIRRKGWFVMAAVAFAVTATPAFADIFSFKDEKGVVHFTNIKGLDPRYKLVRREGGRLTAAMEGPMHTYMPSLADMEKYSAIVKTASLTYGVDASLVHAVISAESAYNPYAVSKAGAMGLMQLMPDTARRYGVDNMVDPAPNGKGVGPYLRGLPGPFGGRITAAAPAPN